MDVDRLGEELDIIHNHLTQASHHTLLGDINGELPTQHQASMARDITAGCGMKWGCDKQSTAGAARGAGLEGRLLLLSASTAMGCGLHSRNKTPQEDVRSRE